MRGTPPHPPSESRDKVMRGAFAGRGLLRAYESLRGEGEF